MPHIGVKAKGDNIIPKTLRITTIVVNPQAPANTGKAETKPLAQQFWPACLAVDI